MSTLLIRQEAVDPSPAAIPSRQNLLFRLLTWYRAAVTEPDTEREKAEWQQNSF